MFSGIISHIGEVKSIVKKNNNCILKIYTLMNFKKNEIGSSISCSGACLTLENFKNKIAQFYLSKETINKTIFKNIKVGDAINLEKSLKFGKRISGHFVQGHIDITLKVLKIKKLGKSWTIIFQLPKKYKKYLVYKGSVAINGVSLTLSKIFKNSFEISIIPHTLKLTNLVNLKENNAVNVEFDILSKYIKNLKKK